VLISGIASIVVRGPLKPIESRATAERIVDGTAVDSFGVAVRSRESEVETGTEPPAGADPGR
jgi:hypothetical protein